MKKIIFTVLFIFITFTFLPGEKKEIPYSTIEEKGITFSWRINGEMLDIKLSAPTNGWISVGFDPKFKMKEADFIIGLVKDGKTTVIDSYGTGPTSHKPDINIGGKDNITNIEGKENKELTELSFSIPLNSKDRFDKKLKKGNHILLLAYSSLDDLAAKHKVRTALKWNLK